MEAQTENVSDGATDLLYGKPGMVTGSDGDPFPSMLVPMIVPIILIVRIAQYNVMTQVTELKLIRGSRICQHLATQQYDNDEVAHAHTNH